jgi:transcriptional regulator GlxA family with amidase domain
LFFNRGEPYRVSHPAQGGDDCTVISLPPEVLRDVAKKIHPRAADREQMRFDVTHAPSTPGADLLHRRLYQAVRAGPGESLAVEEVSLALAGHVLRVASRALGVPVESRRATDNLHRDIVEYAKEILAARFRENLALQDLATHVGCSPFHFSRIFRQNTGIGVHQYQTRLRIRTALARIAAGERNLASLAIEFGFSDQAHFSNTFRRALGFPPSRARDVPSLATLVEASKNLQA